MQITLDAEILSLNERDFERVVDKFIEVELYQAVREFLKACLVRIPVQTGFLRGSFQDLASYFRVKGIPFSGSNPTGRKYFPGGIVKTESSGRQFVTSPQEVIQRTGRNSAAFEIQNFINYFEQNDTRSGIPGAPWGSVDAGIEAANARLASYADRFPRIELMLSKVVIRATNSVTKHTVNADIDSIISQMELLVER